MTFDVMTLFPELIERVTSESIIGRARKSGAVTVRTHNIRDYSQDKHRRVDDTPYGGGMGMLMAAPPIYRCYNAVKEKQEGSSICLFMSAQGRVLDQKKAAELSKYDNITILCGHYEGVDRRIVDEIVDEEISIGDYVLTGGELPACVLIDVISRMCEGVLSADECFENESIIGGVLEYPQYTRPEEFNGRRVPDVLLGGDHKKIEKWRKEEALKLTLKNRPDLL
ncbi:MAG: tRNA (guanosine(37)-N1)-methyltransferase TrmD [Ruminococcaceae bacterium]|nr:tRNA (guanosine(37)-N1)-methyltransferase TrmD [Oscillospiraceae bacterium]